MLTQGQTAASSLEELSPAQPRLVRTNFRKVGDERPRSLRPANGSGREQACPCIVHPVHPGLVRTVFRAEKRTAVNVAGDDEGQRYGHSGEESLFAASADQGMREHAGSLGASATTQVSTGEQPVGCEFDTFGKDGRLTPTLTDDEAAAWDSVPFDFSPSMPIGTAGFADWPADILRPRPDSYLFDNVGAYDPNLIAFDGMSNASTTFNAIVANQDLNASGDDSWDADDENPGTTQ